MIQTKEIMRILSDGRARSVPELMDASGLSDARVRAALHAIIKTQRAVVAPKTYALTAMGHADIAARTPTEEARLAKINAKSNGYRARKKQRAIDLTQPIQEVAMRSRPALQAVWGAAHA